MALSTALAFLFLGGAIILKIGPDEYPLKLFIGNSIYPILMRSFLFIIILVVIINGISYNITSNCYEINVALFAALSAIVSTIFASFIFSLIADRLGADIKKSKDLLAASEKLL